MGGRVVLAAILRKTPERRQAIQGHIHLERRAGSLKAIQPGVEVGGKLAGADEITHSKRIRVAENRGGVHFTAILKRHTDCAIALSEDVIHSSTCKKCRACLCGKAAKLLRHASHSAL